MHIKNCCIKCVNRTCCILLCIPFDQQSRMLEGEIYLRINGEQRREYWWWWGVVTPLWSNDASYTFLRSGQNLQRPGVRNLEDLAGMEGRQIKGFLIWFCCSFWTLILCWGDSKIPGSHTFCLPLFVFGVAFLFSFVPAAGKWRIALEMSYWFTNIALSEWPTTLSDHRQILKYLQQSEQN